MLSILGMGAAYPATVITNDFLSELSGVSADEIHRRSGLTARRSCLPLEYIRSTKNSSNREAWKVNEKTPTDLAYEASLQALDRAGITPERIGLIIADCATPRETTPSEAQRLGKRFGHKIPCYDITTMTGAFPGHLSLFSSWRSERLPEYTLSISTNTLTPAVDYSKGDERFIFGDSAAAMVVSNTHKGPLTLSSYFIHTETHRNGTASLGIDGYIRLKEGAIESWILPESEKLVRKASSDGKFDAKKATYIPVQFGSIGEALASKLAVPREQIWEDDSKGYCLGAAQMGVLADRWNEIRSGQDIVIPHAGVSAAYGYVVLRSE